MTVDQVRKLFTSPEFLVEYRAWLEDPVTKKVFEAAGLIAKPLPLSKPSRNTSLYQYGELVGMERILAFAKGADEAVAAVEQPAVEPDYGVDDEVFAKTHPHIAAAKTRRKTAAKAPTA